MIMSGGQWESRDVEIESFAGKMQKMMLKNLGREQGRLLFRRRCISG